MTRSKPSSPPPVNPIHLARPVSAVTNRTLCGIEFAPQVKRTRSVAKATCATCLAIARAAAKAAPASDLPTPRPAPVLPRRKNSRRKGAVGEREFADLLQKNGWPNARRGQQRSGVDQADVIDGPVGYHFEVKRVENLNVWKAMEQAERDAKPDVKLPVVAMRRNGTDWLAVLPMKELLHLLRWHERGQPVQTSAGVLEGYTVVEDAPEFLS